MDQLTQPLQLTFDLENHVKGFASLSGPDGEPLTFITVNMAAIVLAVADDPDLNWKSITSECILHEVLHVIQQMLGKVFDEEEIESVIERARKEEE